MFVFTDTTYGYCESKAPLSGMLLPQATWRGHIVRKRIQYALNYARMSFGDDDLDEDLDFTEVDLTAFDFNEVNLVNASVESRTSDMLFVVKCN